MAREKKATGEAPKKRAPRSKTPVVTATQAVQFPEPLNPDQNLQSVAAGNNGAKQAINIGDDEVRRRAYEIWEQRGRQHGSDADDWFRAESEIRGKSA